MANSVITKVTGTDSSSNRVGSTFYGTCADAATTAAKTVVLADSCVFNNSCLVTGVTIHVKFTNSNTYAKPALQVSNASPKPIMAHGTTYVGTTPETSWYAGAVVSFTYDGTYWIMNDYKIDTDTNTWRDVKLNGTQILGTSTSTGSLNIVPGTYMNITNSSGSVTFEPKETQVTQAQYDALVQAGTVDADTTYFITDRNNAESAYAASVIYDNTISGLDSTNVQSATDELAYNISDVVKVREFAIPTSKLTNGYYLTNHVQLDPGYKFLVWNTCGSSIGWTSNFPIYIENPHQKNSRVWYNGTLSTNTGNQVRFVYLEIKDV